MKIIILFILIFFNCILIQPVFAEHRQINFAGYDWQVKKGYYGPGPNYWNDSKKAVYKDKQGNLHLLVRKKNKQWHSAEIFLKKSLGYGKYSFTVQNRVDKLDKNLVLGLFLYADDEHEIDIELSRWQNKKGKNFQYCVQPFYIDKNLKRYNLKLKDISSQYIINWQPDYVNFAVKQNNKIIYHWRYTGSYNFVPGSEAVHINFWQYKGSSPYRQKKQEVIIEDFSFKK